MERGIGLDLVFSTGVLTDLFDVLIESGGFEFRVYIFLVDLIPEDLGLAFGDGIGIGIFSVKPIQNIIIILDPKIWEL